MGTHSTSLEIYYMKSISKRILKMS